MSFLTLIERVVHELRVIWLARTDVDFDLSFAGKIIIAALVEEYPSVGKLVNGKHDEFREMVEAIAHTYENHDKFVFGWCSHAEMISSIAMRSFDPLPQLVVINAPDLKYHVLEEPPLPQTIIKLLDDLGEGKVALSGGNTFYHRAQRAVYDAITTLANMYKGNPVLTLLLLGLPLAFLSMIIFTSCCTDMFDARDDEDGE